MCLFHQLIQVPSTLDMRPEDLKEVDAITSFLAHGCGFYLSCSDKLLCHHYELIRNLHNEMLDMVCSCKHHQMHDSERLIKIRLLTKISINLHHVDLLGLQVNVIVPSCNWKEASRPELFGTQE